MHHRCQKHLAGVYESTIMAKILQVTDTFLLHHSPPTQPPNKEMFQTVFKDSFSLCQLLLSQA